MTKTELEAIERAAAELRRQWHIEQWECLSGVFGDRLDAAGNCVCCGFKIGDM